MTVENAVYQIKVKLELNLKPFLLVIGDVFHVVWLRVHLLQPGFNGGYYISLFAFTESWMYIPAWCCFCDWRYGAYYWSTIKLRLFPVSVLLCCNMGVVHGK